MIEELTTGALLQRAARKRPDGTALVEGGGAGRRWTYAELLERCTGAARWLAERFAPGERIALYANNLPEWMIAELAAGLAGLTVVTVNPALRERELAHVLGQSAAAGVFMIPAYRGTDMAGMLAGVRDELPNLREVVTLAGWEPGGTAELPAVDPSDAALILYTSGTTGVPKGAVLHHRGVVNNAILSYERMGVREGYVQLSPMPLFHAAGCAMAVLGTVAFAGTLVMPPHYDPKRMLELIEAERPDVAGGVPTMLIGMLDHPDFPGTDVSSVRAMLTGGAIVAPALARRVEEAFGAPLTIVFAQTEASPVITQTAPTDAPDDRAETLGRPLPHTEVKVVDPGSGEPVGPGTIGEICTRGYHVMTGYLDNPEATAAAIDADGWLHTGDLGTVDERGYYRIGGRLKDMIIRGGANIYPREIEQVLFEHPDVADAAVVGVPDDVWGEQVAAFIRPADGRTPDADALFAYCRERLAPYKTPRYWTFLDEFPLTASGKVQKFVLRERYGPASDG